jgi:hypothetical protein
VSDAGESAFEKYLGLIFGAVVLAVVIGFQLRDFKTKERPAPAPAKPEAAPREALPPVVALLDKTVALLPEPVSWGAAEEQAFRELAASPEAKAPGAADALRAALAESRPEAGAVLWALKPEPGLVDFLGASFQDARGDWAREKLVFALGMTRDKRAGTVLRRELRAAIDDYDQTYQVVVLRALYWVEGDFRHAGALEVIAKEEDPRNLSAQALARNALQEIEVRKSKR